MFEDITQFMACSITPGVHNDAEGYAGHIYEGLVHLEGVDGGRINKTQHFTLMASQTNQPCGGEIAGIFGVGASRMTPAYEKVRENPNVFLNQNCTGHKLTDTVPSCREESFGVMPSTK